MTCQEFDKLLPPYVDGEFDVAEREEAEAHLLGCDGCSRKVQTERAFKASLRRATDSAPLAPQALRQRIHDRIRAHERTRMFRSAALYASAAVVVVAAGTVAWGYWPREKERFFLDAAKFHARPLPPEIAERAHDEVEAWFGGKLDHRVPVPRFPDARIDGARISNVQERRAAYISYKKHDAQGTPRTIGLFVFGDADNDLGAQPLSAVELEQRLGYNVAMWRDGEIVYELVTDLDERDIRAMLQAQPERELPSHAPVPRPALELRPASIQR